MNMEAEAEHTAARRIFLKRLGLGALVGGGVAGGVFASREVAGARSTTASSPSNTTTDPTSRPAAAPPPALAVTASRVAADPTHIPPPIRRRTSSHHEFVLEPKEVIAEIEPGVTFNYMTFGGQIPGPLLRVRQGDTVHLTVKNLPPNMMAHNVDLHAVYGPGGGNVATTAMPGQSKDVTFKAMYPGAFIYHCAVEHMDWHISSGMFGMIVVEPPEGLPEVDHEFYVGQHEVYTKWPAGEKGHHEFDMEAMAREDPSYVLLNGERHALTADRHGALKVKVGETARIFFVCGGPNLASSFHPIGNVWKHAWAAGALANPPQRYVQTLMVPPGSCGVFELDFPVPGQVKLVDHALSRVSMKGMLGIIDVEGPEQLAVFNPNPS